MHHWTVTMLFLLSRMALVQSFAPGRAFQRCHQQQSRSTLARRTATRRFLASVAPSDLKVINLLTIDKDELQQHIVSWGFPKYRADQVWKWIRDGVTSIDDMTNLPQALKLQLHKYAKTGGCLTLHPELVSKDGTRKRAYRTLGRTID
jgi:hypothetical protein